MPEPGGRTLRAALADALARLTATSPSAQLDAELLLAHALGRDRSYLRAWPDATPLPERLAVFDELLARRCAGTPIAYLLGCREFWSREFRVSPAVLIPRPETELLVELALRSIATIENPRIVDLGTGSGAIAVTLALERPDAEVHATDISRAALDVARANADALGARAVHFACGTWFEALPTDQRFDLIVSNPPYIADDDPHLDTLELRHEPRNALAAGRDGYAALRRIITGATDRLTADGDLLLEHGFEQAPTVQALLARRGYREISLHRDLQGHPRVTQARIGRHAPTGTANV